MLTEEYYPSGRKLQFGRDVVKRLSQVMGTMSGQAGKTYVSSLQYASQGDWRSYTYGNGLARTYQFNKRLQPLQVTDTQTGQTKPLLDLQPRWGDANGQKINNNGSLRSLLINTNSGPNLATANNFSQGMSYDGVNRLTGWTDGNGLNRTFAYDRFGNLAVSSNSGVPLNGLTPTSTTQYNSQNQLVSGGAKYDYRGNQSQFSTYQLTYDGENRQAQMTDSFSGLTVQYGYDALGERVFKQLSTAQTIYYVYDAFGQLSAEYSTQRSGQSFCGTCYLSWDHLGSTRMITDQNDNLVTRYDYLPFGVTIDAGVGGRTNVWNAYDAVEQKFTGQRRDAGTGLDFFEARYASSLPSRFLSPDSSNDLVVHALNPQRWNRYAYALNNPTSFIDATGKDAAAVNFSSEIGSFGHEGILAIRKDGSAVYAAFGPADQGIDNTFGALGKGEVTLLRQNVPRIEFGPNGLPTNASIERLGRFLAKTEDVDPSTIRINYFQTSDAETAALTSWFAQQSVAARSRQGPFCRYFAGGNNCGTFTQQELQVAHAISPQQASGLSIFPKREYMQRSSFANDNFDLLQLQVNSVFQQISIDTPAKACVTTYGSDGPFTTCQ